MFKRSCKYFDFLFIYFDESTNTYHLSIINFYLIILKLFIYPFRTYWTRDWPWAWKLEKGRKKGRQRVEEDHYKRRKSPHNFLFWMLYSHHNFLLLRRFSVLSKLLDFFHSYTYISNFFHCIFIIIFSLINTYSAW